MDKERGSRDTVREWLRKEVAEREYERKETR